MTYIKAQNPILITKIDSYKRLWDPYCTVATWYLWRDIDEDIVQY